MKTGDNVQLKSGGPPMTVTHVNPDGSVECQWFGRGNKRERGEFPQEAFVPYSPGPRFTRGVVRY